MCSPKRSVVQQSTASAAAAGAAGAAGSALRVAAILLAVIGCAGIRAQQIAVTDAAANRWSQSHSSLLYDLFDAIADHHSTSDKCARDVGLIVDSVRNGETWALKILDTGPHVPGAFVYGDNFWFTATALCQRANEPLPMTLSPFVQRRMRDDLLSDAAPVRMQHRMVYARYSSDMQVDISFPVAPVIHIGLCMPATCSDADVSRYTQSYLGQRSGNAIPFLASFDLNMTVVAVKSVYANEHRLLHTTSFYLLMCIIGFSTIVVLANIHRRLTSDKQLDDHTKSRKSSDEHLPTVPSTESNNNNSSTDRSVIQRIGDCFDIGVNVGELFVHSHPERDVAALAGIRSTVCLWILAFHVNYHSAFAMSNLTELMLKMEWFANQPMFQAFLYVDVFFVISATLMVYNFLRNAAKRTTIKQNSVAQNAVLFVRTVFHRYVRLTPVLIVTMVFSDVIYNFLDEYSPFYMNPMTDFYCKETWWHNLLYVQNFIKLTAMCDSWTWYLACDMQFYVVGLLVLYLYAKRPSSAKWLYVVGTVSLVCISFYSNFVHNISFETNMMLENLDIIYATPWVRMNPFMGGALTGWILYRTRATKVAPGRRWVNAYWSAALVVFLVTLFYTYVRDVSPVYCAVVFSLGKFAFGLFIGSVVLMCHWGCGGALKKMWQMSVFQHLSKLSYCIYMISPLVITFIHGAKDGGTHFDEMQSLVSIIATAVLSYVAAVLLAVFYELPFQKLSDEFVLKRTKRIAAK